MVSTELGIKRTCPSCAARFYDLNKHPAVCPKCQTAFVAETILPSKGDGPAPKAPRPAPVVEDVEEVADVELVSLDEVDDGADDDEVAAIEDVDLGEDVVVDDPVGDDVFLEEEEEDGSPVPGIIGPGDDSESV